MQSSKVILFLMLAIFGCSLVPDRLMAIQEGQKTESDNQEKDPKSWKNEDWLDKWVVPKMGTRILGEMTIYPWEEFFLPLRVKKVEDRNLIVSLGAMKAWVRKRDVIVDLDEAESYYKDYIKKNPRNANAWAALAFLHLHQMDKEVQNRAAIDVKAIHKKVKQACQRAIQLDPNCLMAWKAKGLGLIEVDEFEAALKCFEKSVEIDPEFASGHGLCGYVLSEQQETDAAIEAYQKAFKLSQHWLYVFNEAIVLLDHDAERCEALLKKAIRMNPESVRAHYALGYVNYEEKEGSEENYREAARHFRKACELSRWKDADKIDALMHAHRQLGEDDEAEKYAEMASNLRDDDDD